MVAAALSSNATTGGGACGGALLLFVAWRWWAVPFPVAVGCRDFWRPSDGRDSPSCFFVLGENVSLFYFLLGSVLLCCCQQLGTEKYLGLESAD